jgi:hypothetical protein
MFRRVLSALLVFCWVSLSVFDIVEDLDAGQTAVSNSFPDDRFSKRGGLGPVADNIVESAARTEQVSVPLGDPISSISDRRSVSIFRRQFQLHKLYRVFVI